jgi:hypothetical protein
MAQRTDTDYYQRGLELAEACKYQEALACIQEHLCEAPEDAQALNDAGAVLYCLGRCNEAIDHFAKARSLDGGSSEILWNLAEAYFVAGRASEAVQLFDDMDRKGMLSAEVLNKIANVFLGQDNKAGAIEMLQRSLEIEPDQKILQPMIEVIRSKMPKLAFFCGGDGMGYLNEIAEFLGRRFEVQVFEGETEEELLEVMEWSDISWFEPCSLAVMASQLPKLCTNIVRADCYEAYKQWPKEVDWSNVDILITIGSSFVRDTLIRRIPGLESQTTMVTVPNGVNIEKFVFSERPRGKNIAFLAGLRMLKNPAFVLQCMQKLHYIDQEYRLFFGGEFADAALEQYIRHMVDALDLRDVVFFDGRQKDVSRWLEDKHYIVSTSIIESQSRGVLEGMTCGLKPVVHNFPGADQVFPSEFLFNISEEFCEQILSDKYESHRYRRFVEENYPLGNQMIKINDVFVQLESGSVPTQLSCEIKKGKTGTRIAEYRIPITSGLSQITDREAIIKGF